MIVVIALGQFEYRMARLEMVSGHQAGGLELREYPVDRCQSHVLARIPQCVIDVLRTQVPGAMFGRFQYLQDFDARQGDFQTRLTQFLILLGHGAGGSLCCRVEV